jgi:rhodanese-related sulfurtransferase
MIPGSVHVPGWKIMNYMHGMKPESEIILVCYQGDVLSPRMYVELYRKGFHNVKVLKGGLFGYFAQKG